MTPSGRWIAWLEASVRDFHHAGRALSRSAAFTSVAVLTLGLGIGASTAIFSMLNAVILRPLPYAAPQRLVVVWTDDVKRQRHETLVSFPVYAEWRARSAALSALGLASLTPVTVIGEGQADRVDAARVSAATFAVLGAAPLSGRPFSVVEEHRRDPVALVSEGFARGRFGSVSAAVGVRLNVDGRLTEIIGVMPGWFQWPSRDIQLWIPLGDARARVLVVGRLATGYSVEQAREELNRIGNELAHEYPALAANPDFPGFDANVVPLEHHVTGRNTRVALWVTSTLR